MWSHENEYELIFNLWTHRVEVNNCFVSFAKPTFFVLFYMIHIYFECKFTTTIERCFFYYGFFCCYIRCKIILLWINEYINIKRAEKQSRIICANHISGAWNSTDCESNGRNSNDIRYNLLCRMNKWRLW